MTVELWMGAEFEHAHEMRALRALLAQMVERFAEKAELYLVLANFFCEGEEIDLVVIKQRAVIILELKECDAPVDGGPNGEWRTADGATLNAGRRNPFQQVRHYRYAVMNYLTRNRFDFLERQKAMQSGAGKSFEHVSGLVIFSPFQSTESNIEISKRDRSWFGTIGLDVLWQELADRRSDQININQGEARKLAHDVLHLTRYDVNEYLGRPIAAPDPQPEVVPIQESIEQPTHQSVHQVRESGGIDAPQDQNTPAPVESPLQSDLTSSDFSRLTQVIARDIINALRRGTVPETGLEFLAVGLEREIRTIGGQLEHVANGRGDFKFVRGEYGAGKTFLGALALEEALRKGFVVSYVVVSTDTPLYKLEAIYQRVVHNLRTRGQQQAALKGLIDRWLYHLEDKVIELEGYDENDPRLSKRVLEQIEQGLADVATYHSAFSAAMRGYYQAQVENDYATAQSLLGWLSGESQISATVKRRVNIRGEIDSTVALSFIRAINAVARQAGMAGLIIVFDEVETIQRLRKPQREQSLSTLRQLVDAIDYGEFPYTYLMFTGTSGFFDDQAGVPSLQPLHDRIKLVNSDDRFPNPELPQLVLPRFDNTKLRSVAEKVIRIYEAAYAPVDRARISDIFIEFMIAEVTSKFGGRVDVVPRQFLRALVDQLDKVRQYTNYIPDVEYEFAQVEADVKLEAAELEAIEPVTF